MFLFYIILLYIQSLPVDGLSELNPAVGYDTRRVHMEKKYRKPLGFVWTELARRGAHLRRLFCYCTDKGFVSKV